LAFAISYAEGVTNARRCSLVAVGEPYCSPVASACRDGSSVLRARENRRSEDGQRTREVAAAKNARREFRGRKFCDAEGVLGTVAEVDERRGDVVMPQTSMSTDSVIVALEEQLGCYRRLSKLQELQHDHVQQSRTEQLLEVLGQRQSVLDDVARLEQTIGPAKRPYSAGAEPG